MKHHLKIPPQLLLAFVFVFIYSCSKKEPNEALKLRTISNNTILKNHTDGADYISGNLEVNAELIIEAGVKILFEEGAVVHIGEGGSISINGTLDIPVVFSSINNKPWSGLIFNTNTKSTFSHFQLKNASYGDNENAAITLLGSSALTLNNSSIVDGKERAAMSVRDSAILTIKDHCTFENCLAPFQKDLSSKITLENNINILGNKKSGILIGKLNQTLMEISANTQLDEVKIPYYIESSIKIKNCSLHIASGVNIFMAPNCSFQNTNYDKEASINFAGTASKPITIQCSESNQNWQGITLYNGHSNITYTNFKNILQNDTMQGVINVRNQAFATILGCNFTVTKTKCAITIIGKGTKINSSAYTANYFNLKSRICEF